MRPALPTREEILAELKRQGRSRWNVSVAVTAATGLTPQTPFFYLRGDHDCSTKCYRAIVAEVWKQEAADHE